MDSLDEALWRVAAFADAGADALFIDALRTKEELRAFCAIAPEVPKMANMLEGGGAHADMLAGGASGHGF